MGLEYLPSKEAAQKLGVSDQTLRNWANAGKIDYIRTPGNQRKYNVSSIMEDAQKRAAEEQKRGKPS
jgi:excisionase family DNA binding protein